MMKLAGYAVAALGIALHLYIALVKADGGFSWFLVGLTLVASLPYLIGLALLRRTARPLVPLAGMIFPLAIDLYLYYTVFVHPKGSTAAIGLVLGPIWTLVIALPIGLAIGWGLERLRGPD